jgi:hypothetical protein
MVKKQTVEKITPIADDVDLRMKEGWRRDRTGWREFKMEPKGKQTGWYPHIIVDISTSTSGQILSGNHFDYYVDGKEVPSSRGKTPYIESNRIWFENPPYGVNCSGDIITIPLPVEVAGYSGQVIAVQKV